MKILCWVMAVAVLALLPYAVKSQTKERKRAINRKAEHMGIGIIFDEKQHNNERNAIDKVQ